MRIWAHRMRGGIEMTPKQEKALVALIRAPTRAAAAKEAGVGVSTLRRWLKEDQNFRAAYKAAMSEMMEDASAQAKQNLSKALGVLADVMENGENSQVRIAAARSALEYSLKLTDAVETSARLDALEEQIWRAEKNGNT